MRRSQKDDEDGFEVGEINQIGGQINSARELLIRQQRLKYENDPSLVKKIEEKANSFREMYHESPKFVVMPKWLVEVFAGKTADVFREFHGRELLICGYRVIESPAILELDDIMVL